MRWIVHARGPMTHSAVLTCFPSLLSSPLTLPDCCYFFLSLRFSLLSAPLFFSCFTPCVFSPHCISPYSCLLSSLSHLLPLLFTSQGRVGSRDRDVFITRGTNPCRVMSLQDRRDNSSGLVMHRTTEYMDINQHICKHKNIF